MSHKDNMQIRKLEREKLQCNEKANRTKKKKPHALVVLIPFNGYKEHSSDKAQKLKYD